MVFVPIVLLNLLIALMSDSYEYIQDKAYVELHRLRAQIIFGNRHSRFGKLIACFGGHNDGDKEKYLHVMVPKGQNVPRPPQGEYQGVLNALKKESKESEERIMQELEQSEERMTKELKEEVKESEERMMKELDEIKTLLLSHFGSPPPRSTSSTPTGFQESSS